MWPYKISSHVIVRVQETEEEIVYAYKLEPVQIMTDHICPTCKGKKGFYVNRYCADCRDTGKKHVQNEKHFTSMLLSLYPVVEFLNARLLGFCIEKNVMTIPTTDHQSIAVTYSSNAGMHKCYIQAWLDATFDEFLKKLPDEDAIPVTDAMQKTEALFLSRAADKHSFRFAYYGPGRIMLSVPGNACELASDSHGMGMFGGKGFTLFPHNVDHRFHQIEFIVGLATLNDLYRKSLSK